MAFAFLLCGTAEISYVLSFSFFFVIYNERFYEIVCQNDAGKTLTIG